ELTEKGTELQEIKKIQVPLFNDEPNAKAAAEIPFVREATHTQTLELADSAAVLYPVEFRPRALKDRKRWSAVRVQPVIYIPEEHQFEREQALRDALPAIVADVVKNPRLKRTRDFIGTSGDARIVLLDSPEWTWPKELLGVKDVKVVPAARTGPRLLGL